MVNVEVNVEVSVSYSPQYGEEGLAIVLGPVPPKVAQWIEWSVVKSFTRTQEEVDMGWLTCPRKVVFEVDVVMVDGKIKDATCQTVCPNFVKAWVEQEAMKQVTVEKEVV